MVAEEGPKIRNSLCTRTGMAGAENTGGGHELGAGVGLTQKQGGRGELVLPGAELEPKGRTSQETELNPRGH